ncbi:MAG: AmmeMemoRadiSam system radical SAM enzyme [Candidatus Ranarchaeia archaeon]
MVEQQIIIGMMSKGIGTQAQLFEKVGRHNKIRCILCPHRCLIESGQKGFCQVKINKDGVLYSEIYGKVSSTVVEPIEKRPFFHFWPGSLVLTISSVGCTMRCQYCQNWQISQAPIEKLEIPYMSYTPEDIIVMAKKNQCQAIGFAYNEPIVWYEYVKDVAAKAQENNIKIILVTNGYVSSEAIEQLAKVVDAVNIDVKAFNDRFYRKICGVPTRKPVLDAAIRFKEKGVHVELSHLLIPGETDKLTEIRLFSEWVHDALGPDTPVHFLSFYPAFKMLNISQTPIETLNNAQKIARSIGLRYPYISNLRGSPGENTYCPSCGAEVIRRQEYAILKYGLSEDKKCNTCNEDIPVIGKYTPQNFHWRKSYL